MKNKNGISDGKWFDILVVALSIIIIIIVAYPLLFVLSASVSDPLSVTQGKMWLFPVDFNLNAYKEIFSNEVIWTGFRNTLIYTTLGTAINLALTILLAYPLSRQDLPGRNLVTLFIVFTMFFNGGLIPTFLVVQNLGLIDTIWAMVLPNAIATWNVIIMRTYFQESIPWELQESAMIDGASNFTMLTKIILPLSKPIIAVMVLFSAVGHWNSWFNALIYLRRDDLVPLQLVLREIMLVSDLSGSEQTGAVQGITGIGDRLLFGESVKYALVVVSSLPVLVIYPFVQKHFVKGVMLGSLKG